MEHEEELVEIESNEDFYLCENGVNERYLLRFSRDGHSHNGRPLITMFSE